MQGVLAHHSWPALLSRVSFSTEVQVSARSWQTPEILLHHSPQRGGYSQDICRDPVEFVTADLNCGAQGSKKFKRG